MKPLSVICDTQAHCAACRDREGGRAWRQSLRTAFVLPGGDDFECPSGKPWGFAGEWTPDQPSRGVGDTLAKLTHAFGLSPCGGCQERQSKLNKIFPYRRAAHDLE